MKHALTDARTRHYGAKLSTFAKIAALAIAAVVAATYAGKASAQTSPIVFTLETSSTDGKSVVPRLTWSTTPAASSCTASGGWSGTKAAAGTQLLPAVTTSQSYTIRCDWQGTLTPTVRWTAPTQNVDGSPYTNPGGYRVQYGRNSTTLDTSVYINDPAARSWTVTPALTAGGWCFTVRAFNAQGLESDPYTPPDCDQYAAGTTESRTLNLGITFPKSPGDLTVSPQ